MVSYRVYNTSPWSANSFLKSVRVSDWIVVSVCVPCLFLASLSTAESAWKVTRQKQIFKCSNAVRPLSQTFDLKSTSIPSRSSLIHQHHGKCDPQCILVSYFILLFALWRIWKHNDKWTNWIWPPVTPVIPSTEVKVTFVLYIFRVWVHKFLFFRVYMIPFVRFNV